MAKIFSNNIWSVPETNKERLISSMEIKHNVEYMLHSEGTGSMKVRAQLGQKELAELLLNDGVELLSVNKNPAPFYPHKRKRK